MADKLRIVVAVDRPSELSDASFAKSDFWRAPYATPQQRQNRNGAPMKLDSIPPVDSVPSAATRINSGAFALWLFLDPALSAVFFYPVFRKPVHEFVRRGRPGIGGAEIKVAGDHIIRALLILCFPRLEGAIAGTSRVRRSNAVDIPGRIPGRTPGAGERGRDRREHIAVR